MILVNLLLLRQKRLLWAAGVALPYLFGFFQIQWHAADFQKAETYSALLIQTAFPSEETIAFPSQSARIAFVIDEWRQILKLAKNGHTHPIDLIALPEFVVPYGTYSPIFPHRAVAAVFQEIYGPEVQLPPLEFPLAEKRGSIWYVSNAYWLQGLANLFQAEAVSGLEDAEELENKEIAYYSAAIHLQPNQFTPQRYEKRVLMPMGEYIPFAFLRSLAASYGIQGSFTPGKEAKIVTGKQPLGLCICYEETFGHLMRENSQKGAKALVNLTNDGWYPRSSLPERHLDHARVRTVENGLPLLRACNTGVTAALDSHGRLIAALDNQLEQPGALLAKVPLYTYDTLYRKVGDTLIIVLSSLSLLFFFRKNQ